MISVIAQHEVLIRWDQLVLTGGRPIVVVGPSLREIWLVQDPSVDVYDAVCDVGPLAPQPDDALYEITAGFFPWLVGRNVPPPVLGEVFQEFCHHRPVLAL